MPQPPPNPCLAEGIDGEGPRDELTVEPRAPSSGVDSIHCQGVVIRANPDELRQPREPRAARPTKVESGPAPAETSDVVGCERPRPDRAHVTAKNVDELRQLIEACGAEQPSHPGDPAGAHRSELQDVERPAPVPDPFLPKDHRPTVIDPHRHRDHHHRRGKRRQSGQGPDQIERPLRPRHGSGSKLCRDEVQPVRGGQIKRIADERRRRIEGASISNLPQQLLSPSGTKNGHAAFNVPDVKPVAGQQEASPDSLVRLVLPDVGAGQFRLDNRLSSFRTRVECRA